MKAVTMRRDARRMTLFLADDSRTITERLTTLLAQVADVEVIGKATDVPAAVRGIQTLEPDAVITDLHMPGGTGIDVIGAAKRLRSTTRVIVLTNSSLPEYRAKCQEAGADRFFDKSAEFDRVPKALLELSEELRQTRAAEQGPVAKAGSRPSPPRENRKPADCHRSRVRRSRPVL